MVNKTTGEITSPVDAATFKTANSLGGAPEAHAASHAAAGSDPVTLAQSQITNLTTDLAAKAAAADLTSHTSNVSNPHSVTKAQVGLSNADNTSDVNKPVSTATQTALDLKADDADLTAHTGNTSNPHSVTKAQVGLSNADNTSDANKPISTATQTALDNKQPLATVLTNTTAAFTTAQETKLAGIETGAQANVALASQAEAEAGTEATKTMTPQRVAQAIAALATPGSTDADDINIADAGGYFTGTEVEAALQEAGASITALQNVGQPSPTGNQLISGGGVALVEDLTVSVAAATYTIAGTQYSSPLAELTADTADPTNPRIDVVAVNTSGVAVIIEGTPAATPVKPDVDPTTHLELTFFVVGAGATSLATNVVDVYRENTEYTMTENGTSITLDSTNNPHLGTKCIEATSAGSGDYFQAEAGAPIDLGDYDNLVFFIRNKAAWASAKQINITARSSGTQKGSSVTFKHGLFGFDQTNTTTYQQIVIPASLFAANGQSVNQIRWAVAGGGGAIGFYVDDITLQGGLAPLVDATRMKWRGDWSADLMYNVNDVTKRSGLPYVSTQAGVNKDPATQPTYWEPMLSGLADPGGDRILFWDDSEGEIKYLTVGTGLTIAGTTIEASGGGGGTLTLMRWSAIDGQPPASNFATFDTRNSIAVLDFDDTTAESMVFVGIVPEGADFTTGVTVRLIFAATSATSGNIIFTSAFERGNTDMDSDSFATGIDSSATATNGTSGIPTVASINHSGSEIDGIAAGDLFRIKITRKAADGSDTMSGDAELIAVEIRQR